MWLGIDASSWAQLWSGCIGSFVAAVVGGLVALMVVRLTNSHQSRLAAKARVVAAIADFCAAIVMFPRTLFDDKTVIQALVKQAEFAGIKLFMDLEDRTLAKELRKWPLELGSLALKASTLYADGQEAPALAAQDHLYTASREIVETLVLWPHSTSDEVASWGPRFEAFRKSFSHVAKRILV